MAPSRCRMGPQGPVLGWSQGSSCPPWSPATLSGLQGGLGCRDGVQDRAPRDTAETPPSPHLGAKRRGWTRGVVGAWLLQCDGHRHAGCMGLSIGAPSAPHACPVGPGPGALGSQPEPGARGGLRGLSAGQVRAHSLQAQGRTWAGECMQCPPPLPGSLKIAPWGSADGAEGPSPVAAGTLPAPPPVLGAGEAAGPHSALGLP